MENKGCYVIKLYLNLSKFLTSYHYLPLNRKSLDIFEETGSLHLCSHDYLPFENIVSVLATFNS